MQLSSIIAKKKKGDESWNQSKLWFSCNRIIWQIQKKWILHELQQNIFPVIWLISCMHTQHTCSIHESWHKMMMNHELWNSIFFLCVCVCVWERERERELPVTSVMDSSFSSDIALTQILLGHTFKLTQHFIYIPPLWSLSLTQSCNVIIECKWDIKTK